MNWREHPYLRNWELQAQGRSKLQEILAASIQRFQQRRPQCSILNGVPDTALFCSRFDTMREHIDGMRCSRIRKQRVLGEQMRQGACWVDPMVPEPCVVTTWR